MRRLRRAGSSIGLSVLELLDWESECENLGAKNGMDVEVTMVGDEGGDGRASER